jgi:hypothetical protein
MNDGICLAKDSKELYTITGYGRFGTLYLLDLEDLERLKVDLDFKLNELRSGLTDKQLSSILESASEGNLKVSITEEENE